ncbi:hypothetical protein TNCV_608741 [Trichonephila clavipes]|nr:hypothetical protein TNCV_608741 [Trichonephila clavipes]
MGESLLNRISKWNGGSGCGRCCRIVGSIALKSLHVEGIRHVQSAVAQSPNNGLVWMFGEENAASGCVHVIGTRLRFVVNSLA